MSAAATDSLTSWAEALDLLADARARWEEAGRPATTAGSTGQLSQHPLARSVERARRHEAQLGAALERILRRIPKDDGMPVGAEPVDGRPGVVRSPDGVEYFRTSKGQWILTMDEFNASWGYLIKLAPGRFIKAPRGIVFEDDEYAYDDESGYWPTPGDDQLRRWAEGQGVPVGPVLEWGERERANEARWVGVLAKG